VRLVKTTLFICAICICLSLFSISPAVSASNKAKDVNSLIKQGKKLLKKKDFKAARVKFANVVIKVPTYSPGWAYLGLTYSKMKKARSAYQAMTMAIVLQEKKDDRLGMYHQSRAIYAAMLGMWNQAFSDISHALELRSANKNTNQMFKKISALHKKKAPGISPDKLGLGPDAVALAAMTRVNSSELVHMVSFNKPCIFKFLHCRKKCFGKKGNEYIQCRKPCLKQGYDCSNALTKKTRAAAKNK
jgi:tetratricopeptide (TPR) repeat protein